MKGAMARSGFDSTIKAARFQPSLGSRVTINSRGTIMIALDSVDTGRGAVKRVFKAPALGSRSISMVPDGRIGRVPGCKFLTAMDTMAMNCRSQCGPALLRIISIEAFGRWRVSTVPTSWGQAVGTATPCASSSIRAAGDMGAVTRCQIPTVGTISSVLTIEIIAPTIRRRSCMWTAS